MAAPAHRAARSGSIEGVGGDQFCGTRARGVATAALPRVPDPAHLPPLGNGGVRARKKQAPRPPRSEAEGIEGRRRATQDVGKGRRRLGRRGWSGDECCGGERDGERRGADGEKLGLLLIGLPN
jgi:hypothetical protein